MRRVSGKSLRMAAGLALGAAGLVFAQSAPHLIERGFGVHYHPNHVWKLLIAPWLKSGTAYRHRTRARRSRNPLLEGYFCGQDDSTLWEIQ